MIGDDVTEAASEDFWASELQVQQGRLLSAKIVELEELRGRLREQEKISDGLVTAVASKSTQVEELENQLTAKVVECESYWRAAEALRLKVDTFAEHQTAFDDLRRQYTDLQESVGSQRAQREHAEQIALAELRAQTEVEQRTRALEAKVRSQEQVIVEMTSRLAENAQAVRASEPHGRDGGGGGGEEALQLRQQVAVLEVQVRTQQQTLEEAKQAHLELFTSEHFKRVAAETALGEFRSVESRTTDSWRRALQDEREDFLRKMQEAMALAESKHEEVSRLQASTQGLEERVAVTSSRLRQREDALQALEAEFETFRQSTAQATHDQLEEMSSIVEAQQAEIARAHMVIEGAKDWQEELRALCSHMGPHGSSSPGGPPETPGSVSQQASAANRPLLPHIAVLLGQLIRGGAGNTVLVELAQEFQVLLTELQVVIEARTLELSKEQARRVQDLMRENQRLLASESKLVRDNDKLRSANSELRGRMQAAMQRASASFQTLAAIEHRYDEIQGAALYVREQQEKLRQLTKDAPFAAKITPRAADRAPGPPVVTPVTPPDANGGHAAAAQQLEHAQLHEYHREGKAPGSPMGSPTFFTLVTPPGRPPGSVVRVSSYS